MALRVSFAILIVICAAVVPVVAETETSQGFFTQLWDSIFGTNKPANNNETVPSETKSTADGANTTELSTTSSSSVKEKEISVTETTKSSSTIVFGQEANSTEGGHVTSSTTPKTNETERTSNDNSLNSASTSTAGNLPVTEVTMTTVYNSSVTEVPQNTDATGSLLTTSDLISTTVLGTENESNATTTTESPKQPPKKSV
ncbi:AGAP004771-PA-like protein [Anopheles sinensis]|uniref:AGAP004771-PA-like protein n=1 Tax=Anopheles sinensis TaxID=74873 RepID=A0A084VZR2_ANOSI|nr:AGAP004771-PA-like protein [Anopheles sinensis]